jgi:hypothetical protein
MQNEPIEVTWKVTQVLEKLNIPYLIGGSLASTLYGMVRITQDSDIVAEIRWLGEIKDRAQTNSRSRYCQTPTLLPDQRMGCQYILEGQ